MAVRLEIPLKILRNHPVIQQRLNLHNQGLESLDD